VKREREIAGAGKREKDAKMETLNCSLHYAAGQTQQRCRLALERLEPEDH
jgi:hypothetical protein